MKPVDSSLNTSTTHQTIASKRAENANSSSSSAAGEPSMRSRARNATRSDQMVSAAQIKRWVDLGSRIARDALAVPGTQMPMDKEELIAYSKQPFSAADIRPIPRTWRADMVSSEMMWDWSQKVTAPHQALYAEQGMKAYAAAVMATIFRGNQVVAWNLPAIMLNLCVVVDAQIIKQTLNLGLSDEQQSDLRERIAGAFLVGRILIPYLRPDAVRTSEPTQRMSAVDGALFAASSAHWQLLTQEVMYHGERYRY